MTRAQTRTLATTLALTLGSGIWALAVAQSGGDGATVARGRYIVQIAGCNDCHTPGYPESGGKVPESKWLVGTPVGWRGPWGTTYPSNVRLYMQGLTEDQWVTVARSTEMRPPMPWFTLRDMTEKDLRALYRFVRTLGPAGEPAPAYVPPDRTPKGPVIEFPPAM
jgi:mono/diheme cytochrome c family protein